MTFAKNHNKGESVALFWDYENCHAIGYHGHLILDRINQKVQEIYGTNIVKESYIYADMSKLNPIFKKKSEQLGYVNCDVSCLKPEAVDKRIIADIALYCMDCKDNTYNCNIIIVSGDGDYLYFLTKLKQKLHVKSVTCFTRTDASVNMKNSTIMDRVEIMFDLERKNKKFNKYSSNNINSNGIYNNSDEKVAPPINKFNKYGSSYVGNKYKGKNDKYNKHYNNGSNTIKCNNQDTCEYYTSTGCKFYHDIYSKYHYSKYKLYKKPKNSQNDLPSPHNIHGFSGLNNNNQNISQYNGNVSSAHNVNSGSNNNDNNNDNEYIIVSSDNNINESSESPKDSDNNGALIKFYVLTETGQCFTCNMYQMDTILSVKQNVQDRSMADVNKQKLMYNGKALQNNKTLNDYEINDGYTIFLLFQ